jgi:predicted dehydrogenase
MKTIVVEGIGDIVSRQSGYGSALRKLKLDYPSDLEVIFTYKSDLSEDTKKRDVTIASLREWGAEVFDKADDKDNERYLSLMDKKIDVVIVATNDESHVEVARPWLGSNCETIFIEKPLAHTALAAQELVDYQEDLKRTLSKDELFDHPIVLAFDHYRARLNDALTKKHFEILHDWLNQSITKIRFFFVEDQSGTDDDYLQKEVLAKGLSDENGPLENAQRLKATKSGLIYDQMSHLPAILLYFGDPTTIRPYEVRAAKYTGVKYDDAAEAGIPYETFAAVKFNFNIKRDEDTYEVLGEAYIGKGILGVSEYKHLRHNTKVLEVTGANYRKIVFDLVNGEVWALEGGKREALFYTQRNPYYYFVSALLENPRQAYLASMSVDTGLDILNILDKMHAPIKQRVKEGRLQTYRLGQRDRAGQITRECLLLDDLLLGDDEIEPLPL